MNYFVITPDLSILEHNNTIGVLRDVWFVSDEHNGDSMIVIELLKQRHHFHRGPRVQVSCRLISQNERWLIDKRPGYRHALLLSTRKLIRATLLPTSEPDFLQRLIALRRLSSFSTLAYSNGNSMFSNADVRESRLKP